jgi:hypothetical protein
VDEGGVLAEETFDGDATSGAAASAGSPAIGAVDSTARAASRQRFIDFKSIFKIDPRALGVQ